MPSPPRTPTALANMELATRSDFLAAMEGVQIVCDQLSLIILGIQDELYVRIGGGRDYSAKRKARNALRPLGGLARAVSAAGRLAPRAYRKYAKEFAEEISPGQSKKRFDHTK